MLTAAADTQSAELLHPAARRLLDRIQLSPREPLHAVLLAPGGLGKSLVLAEIERSYADAGLTVLGAAAIGSGPPEPDPDTALVIDDAHLLDECALEWLHTLAVTGAARLVVAYRPHRIDRLHRLGEELSRAHPPTVLTTFDPERTTRLLRLTTGREPDAGLAARLHTWTAGIPRLVHRAGVALRDPATAGDAELPGLLDHFRTDLATLDEQAVRYLVAADAGVGGDLDLVGELLDTDRAGVSAVIDEVRAAGLFDPADRLPPVTRMALRALVPGDRRLDTLQRLVELRTAAGQPVLELACALLGTGVGGTVAGLAFENAAREALSRDTALAAKLFGAAAQAGRPLAVLAGDWAEAAALSGDLDTARRLSELALDSADPRERDRAATVAGIVLVHHGQHERGAALLRQAASGTSRAFAALGVLGAGHEKDARELLAAPVETTMLADAADGMARGVLSSVTQNSAEALAALLSATVTLEPSSSRATLLPDSPAALAALVALHSGELRLADATLRRALEQDLGGLPMRQRHRLLLGWVAMSAGDLVQAGQHAAAVRNRPLHARDELFAAVLDLALARRDSDIPRMRATWDRAYQAAMRHSVDLYVLHPLGELMIAAARLERTSHLAAHQAHLSELADRLEYPPLWTATLCWNRMHTAIVTEDRDDAAHWSGALGALAGDDRFRGALAEAGRCWITVLANDIELDPVLAATAELHSFGLSWDAARLAGQAAIRSTDRRAMVALLEAARQYQGRPPRHPESAGAASATGPADSAAPSPAVSTALSDRELQVARLVTEGMTYRQIGAKLFISGKTVEHHVARMRAKLGASDRPDLLRQLRHLLDGGDQARPAASTESSTVDT